MIFSIHFFSSVQVKPKKSPKKRSDEDANDTNNHAQESDKESEPDFDQEIDDVSNTNGDDCDSGNTKPPFLFSKDCRFS